ncbi:hypothetical protein BX666DRAFT_1997846 [Dichotomocladium elegans]|nr:hypothetical protein BX666DRAFT_1997846 [Dichotomocladium elegans]
MVAALDRQYSMRQSVARSKLVQSETIVADLRFQIAQLNQQRNDEEQTLAILEENLQAMRAYAQQRYTKKAKREKQYNQYYFVPLLKGQYQKKYMRARDKNANAEEQVAQVRADIETIQSSIRQTATQMDQKQKELDTHISHGQDTSDQIAVLDGCMDRLHEGQQFWARFNQYQAQLLLEACDHLLAGQQQQQQQHRLSNPQTEERDWTVVFRSVCKEYEEREAQAIALYDQYEVEFECARCRRSIVGCPTPDKVHTSDLLCVSCYQETRTSMVMEKKMMAIGGKLGIDQRRPEGPRRLSSSSRMSAATSSSSGSTLVEGAKHALKTMIHHKKKGKTSSSPLDERPLPPKPGSSYLDPHQQGSRPLLA